MVSGFMLRIMSLGVFLCMSGLVGAQEEPILDLLIRGAADTCIQDGELISACPNACASPSQF